MLEFPGEDKAAELTNIYGALAANARYDLHTGLLRVVKRHDRAGGGQ
jgi:hypothetical protein